MAKVWNGLAPFRLTGSRKGSSPFPTTDSSSRGAQQRGNQIFRRQVEPRNLTYNYDMFVVNDVVGNGLAPFRFTESRKGSSPFPTKDSKKTDEFKLIR